MPPPPEYWYHMSYPSWIYKRCSDTFLTPYLQPCTYQFHQRTPYISTGTCILMSWLRTNSFLLLIDIPIQDRACQITVHQVFTLDIPYGNYSACYDMKTKYFGVTKDVTMGVELSTTQFQNVNKPMDSSATFPTPFQPLANPPTCIAALYTKSKAGIAFKCSLQLHKTTTTNLPTQITPDVWILTTPATAPINTVTLICPEKPMETIPIWQLIHILKLPTAYSATSSHFYLPPRYETPILDVNVSLKWQIFKW